jgi:RNA polymerase sigma-70 factor, ECF subfamily
VTTLPEAALADALARGRAAWPGVDVPAEDFARFVAERGAADHAEDCYLACACARGDDAAVRAFEDHVLPEVEAAVRRVVADRDVATEVRQRVRAQLLVGAERGIGDYRGRGALVSWVRIIAVRTALQLLRADRGAERRAAALADEPEPPRFDAELELIKARYREPFRAAFAEALGALTPEERNLISLHVIEGLSLSQIGALNGVNKSTVSRWLAAANGRLEAGIRARLGATLRLDEAELDSLVGLLRSHIDVSVERLLGRDER